MELRDAVRRRRMVRSYDPERRIDPNLLSELFRLATRAPSAGNTQGWQFLVLDDITSRNSFWTATSAGEPDPWLRRMMTAPVLVLCLSDKQAYLDRYAEPDKGWTDRSEDRWPVPYWDIDTGMAAMILQLAAVDAGLGACFFGVPPEQWAAVRFAFGIPERLGLVGVVSLGYAVEGPKSPSLKRGRRPFEDVVRWNRY